MTKTVKEQEMYKVIQTHTNDEQLMVAFNELLEEYKNEIARKNKEIQELKDELVFFNGKWNYSDYLVDNGELDILFEQLNDIAFERSSIPYDEQEECWYDTVRAIKIKFEKMKSNQLFKEDFEPSFDFDNDSQETTDYYILKDNSKYDKLESKEK